MTTPQTVTRKAHDLKGGDLIWLHGKWREVADAYPNTESTFVIAYHADPEIRYHLVNVDDDFETI